MWDHTRVHLTRSQGSAECSVKPESTLRERWRPARSAELADKDLPFYFISFIYLAFLLICHSSNENQQYIGIPIASCMNTMSSKQSPFLHKTL